MSIKAFPKALYQLPISQEERASFTPDELFVLVLAHRLDHLTATGFQWATLPSRPPSRG